MAWRRGGDGINPCRETASRAAASPAAGERAGGAFKNLDAARSRRWIELSVRPLPALSGMR